MKYANEIIFNGNVGAGISGTNNYDPDKIFLGSLLYRSSGSYAKENYITANDNIYIRLGEISGIPCSMPHVVEWSAQYNWIFLFDVAAAAATRRVVLVVHDKYSKTLAYQGFITLNFSLLAGNKTIRGGRALYYKHTDGTVTCAGYAVTGSGTQWTVQKIANGSRIGFGTTDPAQVRQWYNISAVVNDTSITLTEAVNVAAGTSYVIESLWLAIAATSATAGAGGLYLVKGLSFHVFTPSGVTIAEGVWQNNLRAVYQLRDAVNAENQNTGGIAIDNLPTDGQTSSGTHYVYLTQYIGAASTSCFVYNVRATLSGSPYMISGSATLAAFVTKTQPYAHASRTLSQINNARIFTVNHGPASGSQSLYFVGFPSANVDGHVYRAPLHRIISGSTTWVQDISVANPLWNSYHTPSGSYRWLPVQVDYSASLDKILISNGQNPDFKMLIGEYDPRFPTAITMGFAPDTNMLFTTQNPLLGAVRPLPRQYPMSIWTEGGNMYTVSVTPTGQNSILYVVPVGADWNFTSATKQYAISPRLSTSGATRYSNAFVLDSNFATLGTPNKYLSWQPEAYRTFMRTSGIDDNSGTWTVIPDNGDISGIAPATYVQFRFDYKVLGMICQTSNLYGVGVSYEDGNQDSHFKPSLNQSDFNNKIFAWSQIYPFNGTVPNLRITLTNLDAGVSGTQILTDTVSNSYSGSWQHSRDGGTTWQSWSGSYDRPGTFIRYTVTGTLDDASIKAVVTRA
jgi:hypothetical protein